MSNQSACKHWMVKIVLIYQWEVKLNIAMSKALVVVDSTTIIDNGR